ncbi:hypothetical protein NMY22_g17717 [Coprinellus aureogranulatus]|nr:hypothetical protein NMY22_g17717 [Coprinellus aureogranulatus]
MAEPTSTSHPNLIFVPCAPTDPPLPVTEEQIQRVVEVTETLSALRHQVDAVNASNWRLTIRLEAAEEKCRQYALDNKRQVARTEALCRELEESRKREAALFDKQRWIEDRFREQLIRAENMTAGLEEMIAHHKKWHEVEQRRKAEEDSDEKKPKVEATSVVKLEVKCEVRMLVSAYDAPLVLIIPSEQMNWFPPLLPPFV